MMNFDEYQTAAERTAIRGDNDTIERRYANFGMGIAGEAGEVCDLLKKVVFHGHEIDKEKLIKELGDVLWYVSTIATTANIPLAYIAEHNIAKLQRRYPDGFSEQASKERKE
jgi:NTP pyrophosphatase (non-canonical NTP hydrolase)